MDWSPFPDAGQGHQALVGTRPWLTGTRTGDRFRPNFVTDVSAAEVPGREGH
jgi:hypothetical protein